MFQIYSAVNEGVESVVLHNSEETKSKGRNVGILWNANCLITETFCGISHFLHKEISDFWIFFTKETDHYGVEK